MSKIDTVRAAMMQAMKDKNKERKDALSVLYYTQPKPTFHIPIAASLESPSRSPIGSLTVSANR